jgi:hypothetical protein
MRNTRENILQSFSIEDFFENELKLRKRFFIFKNNDFKRNRRL